MRPDCVSAVFSFEDYLAAPHRQKRTPRRKRAGSRTNPRPTCPDKSATSCPESVRPNPRPASPACARFEPGAIAKLRAGGRGLSAGLTGLIGICHGGTRFSIDVSSDAAPCSRRRRAFSGRSAETVAVRVQPTRSGPSAMRAGVGIGGSPGGRDHQAASPLISHVFPIEPRRPDRISDLHFTEWCCEQIEASEAEHF
jgi:hypothetical protein